MDEAEFGEWPHVCAVLKLEKIEDDVFPVRLCGASLLDEQVG